MQFTARPAVRGRDELFNAWNALANLADLAGKVSVSVEAKSDTAFDQARLENGVIEPLRELGRAELERRGTRIGDADIRIAHSWSSPEPRLVATRGVGPVCRDDNGRRLLSGGNAPDYMNRSIRSIPLQRETAAAFRIVRIVLDHEGRRNPGDDVANLHCVRRQLFQSMKRDPYVAAGDERENLLDGAAHPIPSAWSTSLAR